MKIPVFGDIHGNIEGMFNSIRQLQRDSGKKFKYVLQVGDLGIYGPQTPLEGHRSNLFEGGFNEFMSSNKLYNKFFTLPNQNDKLECKVFFVRGNHDDPNYLKSLEDEHPEGLIPIDPWGIFNYLGDGRGISLPSEDGTNDLVVVGFGGVDNQSRPKALRKNNNVAFSYTGLNRILSFNDVDILLTHQGTKSAPKGDQFIDDLVSFVKPKIHIHGHGHAYCGPLVIGDTKSYSLGRIPQEIRPTSNSGYNGILNFNGNLQFTPLVQ